MKKIISVCALLFLFAISANWYMRSHVLPSKVEESVLWSLSNFGFEKLKIDKIESENGVIKISGVQIDENAFSTIDKIEIHVGVFDYLFGDNGISSINIDGARLTGSLNNKNEIEIYGIKSGSTLIESLRAVNTQKISFKNSRTDLSSDSYGGVSLEYEGQMSFPEEDIAFFGNVRTNQKKLKFDAKIQGKIDHRNNIKTSWKMEGVHVNTDAYTLRRGVGEALVNYKGSVAPNLNIDLDFASGKFTSLPLSRITIEYNSDKENTLSARGSLPGADKTTWEFARTTIDNSEEQYVTKIFPHTVDEIVSYIGKYVKKDISLPAFLKGLPVDEITILSNAVSGTGKVNIVSPYLNKEISGEFKTKEEITKGKLNVSDVELTHSMNDMVNDFKFSADSEFKIYPEKNSLAVDWKLELFLEDGKLKLADALQLKNISGKKTFSGHNKTRGLPLKFKLPLRKEIKNTGHMNLFLSENGKIDIKDLNISVFNGDLKTRGPIIINGDLKPGNKLIVNSIDIGKMFHAAGFSEIISWGKIGGMLPLRKENDSLMVTKGILQSENSGIIKIPAYIISGLFPGNTQKMREIRATLLNYHYEYFEIRMDGDLNKRVLMTLNSRGYNPDLKNKKVIDINLQIETQISLLFQRMLNNSAH